MLFKKSYLSRRLQCFGTVNAMPSVMPNSSSSASGSVISNEETASYYSIQSLSPAHGTTNDSDTTSATYPNDIYDPDMSLYYSSGFYDNNGYFYVNRMYRGNTFLNFCVGALAMPCPRTTHFNRFIRFFCPLFALQLESAQPMFTTTLMCTTVQRS